MWRRLAPPPRLVVAIATSSSGFASHRRSTKREAQSSPLFCECENRLARKLSARPKESNDSLLTLADMKRMVNEERIVVSFKGVVYDVTKFTGHPGGYGRLEMVAGTDLEAYWNVYRQHNRGHVADLLERYRIGHLSPEEAEEIRRSTVFSNPYVNDPPADRYSKLLTNTQYPYNAEANLRTLRDSFITPIGQHFVRNHGMVPDLDPSTHEVEVECTGMPVRHFTLNDLKMKFPKVHVTSVIQCNGNRREDYHFVTPDTPAFGPPHWVAGAMGCSTWSGCRLRDVLREVGMDVDAMSLNEIPIPMWAKWVGLMGADTDECGNNYCCSFPFEKALDPFGDVILAYEMNGEPIPHHHGFPLRAIVPGHAGARNCKFLLRVEVSTKPCLSAGNWKQYAVHAMDVPLYKLLEFEEFKAELMLDPPVQEMPVQSMVTYPGPHDVIKPRKAADGSYTVQVKGIAWGGGGEDVNRVDVSLDGGKHFVRANLEPRPVKQRRKGFWAWMFFEKEVRVSPEQEEHLKAGKQVKMEVCSKALNTCWNVQPETADPHRNPHGCCVNHWYRVPIIVDPKAVADFVKPLEKDEFPNKPSGGYFKTPFRNFDPVQN